MVELKIKQKYQIIMEQFQVNRGGRETEDYS